MRKDREDEIFETVPRHADDWDTINQENTPMKEMYQTATQRWAVLDNVSKDKSMKEFG